MEVCAYFPGAVSARSATRATNGNPVRLAKCRVAGFQSGPAAKLHSGRSYGQYTASQFSATGSEFCRGFAGLNLAAKRSRSSGVNQRGASLIVTAEAFDNLTLSLQKAWDKLKGEQSLTAANIKEPMKDIRRALLEADVSLPVVRRFVKSIEAKVVGAKVIKGVTPDQQLVKYVADELLVLMGKEAVPLEKPRMGPQVILMAGLQGVGKTTACGKLALALKKEGKSVMMIATDTYRPAAIDQLCTLGKQIDVPVFEMGTDVQPWEIARKGIAEAKKKKVNAIIVDTSGRLQIDSKLMDELKQVKKVSKPTDTLLVVDAMTGQEAAGLVKSFNEDIGITGAVLTKMDGDARGGAALTIRDVSGRPIKFVGTGEKMEALTPFYPDRMAKRILGMGDILSLVEKAQEAFDEEEATKMAQRMAENKFDLEDFLSQVEMMNNMGSMGSMMKMIPGMAAITDKQLAEAEKKIIKIKSMIQSMTPKERRNPELIVSSPSRRRRVARGSGRKEKDVSNMMIEFNQLKERMTQASKMLARQGNGAGMTEEQMMQELMQASEGNQVKEQHARRKTKGRKVKGGMVKPAKGGMREKIYAQMAAKAAAKKGGKKR